MESNSNTQVELHADSNPMTALTSAFQELSRRSVYLVSLAESDGVSSNNIEIFIKLIEIVQLNIRKIVTMQFLAVRQSSHQVQILDAIMNSTWNELQSLLFLCKHADQIDFGSITADQISVSTFRSN